MKLTNLKASRIQIYLENMLSKDKLEDLYYICFGEFPLDNLSIEDLQFNIAYHIKDADEEELTRIYHYLF